MWPDDIDLPVEVHAAFDADLTADPGTWSWTDLSSRLHAEQIRLRAGKSSGAASASPGTCTVALDNDDGALTPLHPMSPYWPHVRRGTPLRVRILWAGVWHERFSGHADQWEPDYLPTTTPGRSHSVVRVTASGMLRRLEQGARPARSAPARFIPSTGPVAYWPLEDGQLVSEGAALVGGQPMRPFTGTHPSGAVVTFAQWGRGELAPWLPEAVSRSGNRGLAIIWAPVPMSATSRWIVDFMYRSGTDAGDSAVDINPQYLGGSLGWPQLMLLPQYRGVDVAMNSEPEASGTAPTLFDGRPHHVRWDVYQNGARVSWNVYVDAQQVNAGTTSGNMTLPAVSTIGLTAGAQAGADMAQGHVAVWSTTPPPVETAVAAAMGHQGETAAARVARLCAEDGVPVSVGSGDSEPLGPQGVAGLMDLLREAEVADMGILAEQGYSLAYQPRGGRYNAPGAMTVDLAGYRVTGRGAGGVLKPVYDDQSLRNEWTVDRVNGGTSGPVADLTHQGRSGVYSDSTELNVTSDSRLVDHASWRVHLGTVEELREATFPLDLAANPDLVDGWLSCGVGSRIVRTNPPAQYGPGPIDRLMEGWTETIGPRSWMVQVTPSPAAPWQVAEVSGEQRVAADGSTLAEPLSTAGTSLLLSSTAVNGPWTTDPTDFPLDIRVGGEQVTASAIVPSLLDQFTRTVASGWGAGWATSGGAVSDYSTNGVSGAHSHGSVGVLRTSLIDIGWRDARIVADVDIPVVPTGAPITHWVVLRAEDLNNHYIARMDIATSNIVTLALFKRVAGVLSGFGAAVPVGNHAGGTVWRVAVDVHGGLLMAKAWRSASDPEPGWQVSATDTGALVNGIGTKAGVMSRLETGNTNALPVVIRWDNFTVASPQTVAVSARAVNGVQRAWPADTPVDVATPAILAL